MLLKQYRTTGLIAAKPFAGGVKLKLNSEQLVILAELISANNDATLAELCDLLLQETNIRVGVSTMFRMLEYLDLTLKKNTSSQRERN